MSDQANPASRPWRRFPRFSVQGMIVLVLAIGIWLGWLVRSARFQHEAVAAIRKAGGDVSYDWQWKDGSPIAGGQPFYPLWLVNNVGVDYFSSVVAVSCPP